MTNLITSATLAVSVLALPLAASAQQKPTWIDKLVSPWSADQYGSPDDHLFRVDGDFCVGYGGAYPVELQQANATFGKPTNDLLLTVPPGTHGGSCGTSYGGAEVATIAGWLNNSSSPPPFGPSTLGYGYYETTMKPSCVQGEVSSFFWIQAPSYGPLELDVEFPNPPGHAFTDVHWTIHPSNQTVDFQLGFSPCQAFHKYGFLWTPGQIVFTVDRVARYTFTDSSLTSTVTGFAMANAWTGNPSWGAGPPAMAAINAYRSFKYLANATSIPANW